MHEHGFARLTSGAFLFAIALLCSVRHESWAQQSQNEPLKSPAVVRTNTRLVIVDVVATDAKGQPVKDLEPKDFSVFENRKQQKISDFAFHHPEEMRTVAAQQLPPHVVSNAPQFLGGSMNVILFDTVNGDFGEHAYAQDQLLKFLSGSQIRHPLAIFALETHLKLLHDFTTDAAELKTAVLHYKPPAQHTMIDSAESRASAFENLGNFHSSDRDIETTLNQLNALAKMLKGYPGRKNLIWLSEGIPLNFFPEKAINPTEHLGHNDTQKILLNSMPFRTYSALVKMVSDALMDAQVAVYPVDAGALGRDSHMTAQHTMKDMAAWTGGEAFINRNDLAASMRTSIDDGSTYYTLEYYPDNTKWDGQFRAIQIKTDRPGVKLRYRLGYYAVDPARLNKDKMEILSETLGRAMEFDAPAYTSVRFEAGVVPPSGQGKKVVVNFAIDPHTISFEHREDGLEHARVACVLWAYGRNKEKPIMAKGATQIAGLKPEVYQQLMKQYFPCKQEIELRPGTYTLRLAVIDRTTSLLGTTNAQITLP
jgi:VWFA-related protein